MNAILRVLMTLPIPAMVLFKMTILLGMAWVLHFTLIRSNPRWRALLWRMMMVCVVLLVPTQLLLPELPLFVIKEAQAISAPASPAPAPLAATPIQGQAPAEPVVQPNNISPPIPQKASSKHKNDKTIALLKEENIDQSLKLLSDVSLFHDPRIGGVYDPTIIIRFPIAIEEDQIDIERILSNRRFLKIYQEFTDMSEHEAGRLLCREMDIILPIYCDLFNASWTQLMTGIKAAPPGMTRSVGPTLQTSDNADHSPTLLGARLKILSIALIAGNLNIASAKPGIKKIVEQAIQQREVYYKGDSQSEADRFCMLTGAGIYNRQILAMAVLGISGSTMDLEVRRLPTFDTPVTPYDSMAIFSDGAEPDYSKGEQKIKFPKPMDDQTFDKIVESWK